VPFWTWWWREKFPNVRFIKFRASIFNDSVPIKDKANSTEESPSTEGNSRFASQEILGLLCNPQFHYRVHNGIPLVPFLSQIYQFHTFPTYFSKLYSNIILPSTPTSSKWSLSFRFSDKYFVLCISRLSYACYVPRLFHVPSFHYPNNILWSVQVMKLLIMQSSPASCHFLPLRSAYFHSTLFSDTLNRRSSLSVRDQISRSYKTTGKIVVLYV
jgi:hypothetical protein